MARAAASALLLLAAHAGVATGNLLDNFEWLKQHGDEAIQAAQHCQNVIMEISKFNEHCGVADQLEDFAAVVAWMAIEQTGKGDSTSFLADLARSPPALKMKEKAQQVILSSTQASMEKACSPGCDLRNIEAFFEAFAGCYAPSVCAAGTGLGEANFHRCRSALQTSLLGEMRLEADGWCQKDESGVYCQQHHAELFLQSPLCYSFYGQPVFTNDSHMMQEYCSECLPGWKKAKEHAVCSSRMMEMARSRGKNAAHMEKELWGSRPGGPGTLHAVYFYDVCFSQKPQPASFMAV